LLKQGQHHQQWWYQQGKQGQSGPNLQSRLRFAATPAAEFLVLL
jgi:hypothetical protein